MSDKGYEVKAVFAAVVKAHHGKGTVTAVVTGETGKSRLLGATSLVNLDLLDEAHHGRFLTADKMAGLLKVPVVKGKADCQAWLSDNKIDGISSDNILSDPAASTVTASSGKADKF